MIYDAVVVGSGPNGLSGAIVLQRAGMQVLLIEGKSTIGGGLRSQSLTLPGYVHDVCSAIHPMALLSPFFKALPLQDYGLQLIHPTFAAAHPFDHGGAAILHPSIEKTASYLGLDEEIYQRMFLSLKNDLPCILDDLLGPLTWPKHPYKWARFGMKALTSASFLSRQFKSMEAKALWAGMAAHGMQPLTNYATSAFGLILTSAAHLNNWPIPEGGSQSIANALAQYFKSLGGHIETNQMVQSIHDLPPATVKLLDVTPRQLLQMAGDVLSPFYKFRLQKYVYGMGVFKMDWALSEPTPFSALACREAGTIHLGNTFEEISYAEKSTARGKHVNAPFVIFTQPSVFDATRAPKGKHTAWAYCHVPHGSTVDMTTAIENQIARFAPGFKDIILERHVMNTQDMERYNPNYVGGDINGGIQNITQLYSRPIWSRSPYQTSQKGLYLCSSSTPPGGGVHGMCGYHAAKQALQDIHHIF
jgi:phytoene dehydrogenase-like protein